MEALDQRYLRFRRIHTDTIIREDLLDLERVRDIKSIEILIDLLKSRVGSTTLYTSLANDLQVSVHTVKHWLQILENLYIIFAVRPYQVVFDLKRRRSKGAAGMVPAHEFLSGVVQILN